MLVCSLLLLTISDQIVYKPPNFHFAETFESLEDNNWVYSQSTKAGSEDSHYNGVFKIKKFATGENGLVMETPSSHYGLSAKLATPFDFKTTKDLYVQFQVQHLVKPDCGGGYIKLLPHIDDLIELNDVTQFTIMFGPDICGPSAHLFFILKFMNPLTGIYEEKMAPHVPKMTSEFLGDNKIHQYTLGLHSSGNYEIYVDNELALKGNILTDLEPPINPAEFIDDMTAAKPSDWDDRKQIIDESITKPEDYDEGGEEMIEDMEAVIPSDWKTEEPLMVKDLSQERPEDWDVELDGDWEHPLIENPSCVEGKCGEWKRPLKLNPNYRGPWKPTMMANPNYSGEWVRPKVRNPDYYHVDLPYEQLAPITAVGFELWSVEGNVAFYNLLVTSDYGSLDNWTAQTFPLQPSKFSKFGRGVVDTLVANWVVVAVVLILLVLAIYLLNWLRSSPVNDAEPSPDDEEDEDDVQFDDESGDEGARQRN